MTDEEKSKIKDDFVWCFVAMALAFVLGFFRHDASAILCSGAFSLFIAVRIYKKYF